jgi:uncharacterized protein (TIGR04255 family)
MQPSHQSLPSFRNPPVDEVAVALQFNGIERFSLAYGAFYERVRNSLPRFEEHDPIGVQFETFGQLREEAPEFNIEAFSLRRGWYVSDDGHRVVQLQPNRIVQNWRKQEGRGEYPRFPVVLADFWKSLDSLIAVTQSLGLSAPEFNQADVTYFNNIRLFENEPYPDAFERVFGWPKRQCFPNEAHTFKVEPEAAALNISARVFGPGSGAPCGRLVATAKPAEIDTGEKVIHLWLRFRGPPPSFERDVLEEFFLGGRAAIVQTFTNLTSGDCHDLWQRER